MSEKLLQPNKEEFDRLLASEKLLLVDFWAAWCGPCKMIAPIIDQLADEFDGKVKIAKLNVDENRDLAVRFKVMSIPTLILFKNGEVANQLVGARPKAELVKLLQNA